MLKNGLSRSIRRFLCPALLLLFTGGCAALKCDKKENPPVPASTPESVNFDCNTTCPAPAVQVSHSPSTVSVTGSEPAPGGSVVSGEEIPQTSVQKTPPPAPPVTMETTSQYLNQEEEILRNPNSADSDSNVSPAGYQSPETNTAPQSSSMPSSIPQSEIPSGYSGLTQTAQNQSPFQNVSQEKTPGRSRIQFQTVIEK